MKATAQRAAAQLAATGTVATVIEPVQREG